MPEVAVNIVTWNSQDFIQTCLKSVFEQTYQDIGVTVVDNGSTDNSVDRVNTFSANKIRLIQNENNRGYAPAHNQAIEASDSRYVLTLNPDVILTPSFIEQLVTAVEMHPSAGSAAGKLLRITAEQFQAGALAEASTIDSAGLFLYRNRRQYLRGTLQNAVDHCSEQAEIFGPDGAAAFYRRAMLEDICIEGDYFDRFFVTHKEDVDLAWRAQLLGWRSLYVPNALAYHVRGFRPGEREPIPASVRRGAVRNRWLMLLKNEMPGLFWRDLPYILLYDLKILGYLVLFEQRSLPALWDALRLLPVMVRRRKQIQDRRKVDAAYMRWWIGNPEHTC